MTARDIIKQAFETEFDDAYSGDAFADKCVAILHEEGYSILAPGEMDRETLEAAARVAAWAHMVPPDGGSPSEEERQVAECAAAAIRALKAPPAETDGEGKQE